MLLLILDTVSYTVGYLSINLTNICWESIKCICMQINTRREEWGYIYPVSSVPSPELLEICISKLQGLANSAGCCATGLLWDLRQVAVSVSYTLKLSGCITWPLKFLPLLKFCNSMIIMSAQPSSPATVQKFRWRFIVGEWALKITKNFSKSKPFSNRKFAFMGWNTFKFLYGFHVPNNTSYPI